MKWCLILHEMKGYEGKGSSATKLKQNDYMVDINISFDILFLMQSHNTPHSASLRRTTFQ